MKDDSKQQQHDEEHEKKMRQLLLIDRLARRLPWITLIISIVAFIIIFLQVIYSLS